MIALALGVLQGCERDRKPQAAVSAEPEPETEPKYLGLAYADRVRADQWTREKGLVENLRILAGERSLREVYGPDAVVIREGTALLHEAKIYLAQGADEATKAELRRLIPRIVPERSALLRVSRHVETLPSSVAPPTQKRSSTFSLFPKRTRTA
jgi:hypothetical protein